MATVPIVLRAMDAVLAVGITDIAINGAVSVAATAVL